VRVEQEEHPLTTILSPGDCVVTHPLSLRAIPPWQVLSLRRKGIRVASDERILGEDKFIQRFMSEVEEREKETLRLGRKVPDLQTLAKRIT